MDDGSIEEPTFESSTGDLPPTPAGDVDLLAILNPPELPGELGRLGGYRVLSILGKGGMGAVFEAEDPHLRRRIALKVMLPKMAAKPSAKARFFREARAQAAVEHLHVVAIHQVGEDNGVPFIAMPLLKGQMLSARLRQTPPLPLVEAVRMGREMALGVAAAHQKGLIHRDIKPGNVWLEGANQQVRLLDFGLARVATEDSDVDCPTLTGEGMVVGTPAYMSPEQGRSEEVDSRSDLFSLGVVLYQMTTGELPFKGSSTLAVLTSLALDAPRPPRNSIPICRRNWNR